MGHSCSMSYLRLVLGYYLNLLLLRIAKNEKTYLLRERKDVTMLL